MAAAGSSGTGFLVHETGLLGMAARDARMTRRVAAAALAIAALVIYGFMFFPGCRIGRIPANGQLFDHMHDRRHDRPGALP